MVSTFGHGSAGALSEIRKAGMMGKGWVWLTTSGVTSKLTTSDAELAKAMDGFLGTGPASGEGSIYLNFLAKWLEKDPTKYPGIVHNLVVSVEGNSRKLFLQETKY